MIPTPSTLLSACCLLGLLLVPRWRRAGAALLGLGAGGFALCLVLPLDQWLLRPLEDRFPPPAPPAHVDGIVVLGGAVSARLSSDRGMAVVNGDAERLIAFAALARRYPEARLVFAGGPPSGVQAPLGEAAWTAELLGRLGLEPGRVLYDDQSRTTWENAVFARALARPAPGETWLLVTSARHMPRAVGAFRAAGWPAVLPWPVAYRTARTGWPAPFQPAGARLAAIDLAAHEWAGLLGYWLRNRSHALLPEP